MPVRRCILGELLFDWICAGRRGRRGDSAHTSSLGFTAPFRSVLDFGVRVTLDVIVSL